MNLSALSQIDLSKLPDTALFAIKDAVKTELKNRGKYRFTRDFKKRSLAKNRHNSHKSPDRIKHFQSLISGDWSHLYPEELGSNERRFYVYAHIDSSAGFLEVGDILFRGIPFYIGKGTGDRAFDLKRNEGHRAEIQMLASQGVRREDMVQIIKSGMTESEALCYEAKLIHFFGTRFDGIKNGLLVNLEKPPTPFD